jgi:hypothetical protein
LLDGADDVLIGTSGQGVLGLALDVRRDPATTF